MVVDGWISKAVKPLPVRSRVYHQVGTSRNGRIYGGLAVARLASPSRLSIARTHVRTDSQSRAIVGTDSPRRSDPIATADRASLLYLSLTRCCAAQPLRTIGPRSTTTERFPSAPHRGDPGARAQT